MLAIPNSSQSTSSNSDNLARGFAEDAPNVTLSLNNTPIASVDQLAQAPSTTSSTNASRPNHIWSQNTRSQKLWLAFSGEDLSSPISAPSVSIAAVHSPPTRYGRPQTFNSEDLTQIQEIDAYLLAYGSLSQEELR